MLQLDPAKRLDVAQVLQICTAQTAAGAGSGEDGRRASGGGAPQAARTFRPAPLLVMEDVVEKLKLLEYEQLFLRPTGFPTLHRCFFTQKIPPVPVRNGKSTRETSQFQ